MAVHCCYSRSFLVVSLSRPIIVFSLEPSTSWCPPLPSSSRPDPVSASAEESQGFSTLPLSKDHWGSLFLDIFWESPYLLLFWATYGDFSLFTVRSSTCFWWNFQSFPQKKSQVWTISFCHLPSAPFPRACYLLRRSSAPFWDWDWENNSNVLCTACPTCKFYWCSCSYRRVSLRWCPMSFPRIPWVTMQLLDQFF